MARRQQGPAVKRRPERPGGLAERLKRAEQHLKAQPEESEDPDARPRPEDFAEAIAPTEDEWDSGPLPPPEPADLAGAVSQSLQAIGVTEADLDALWDAIRADEDRGQRFLGLQPETSSQMRERCGRFGTDFYALWDDTLEGVMRVGFAGFQALNTKHLVTHLYLLTAYRGQAPRLIPQLMQMAASTYPDAPAFVVQTDDRVMARMLQGCGFQSSFMLTWTPVTVTDQPGRDVDGGHDPDTQSDSGGNSEE